MQDGFKHLNQLLDSDTLLQALDAATLRIRQTGKGVPRALSYLFPLADLSYTGCAESIQTAACL